MPPGRHLPIYDVPFFAANRLPHTPVIKLPESWHFLKFCHSSFLFESVLSESNWVFDFANGARLKRMQCGTAATTNVG